ncbi:MAG TPA: adenylosuccinate lyase [Bacteroidia bacterium]|nr:adenylosuccinate lyase [Bacteroidia bacterium]HNT80472.1 adenylosuccinate lyase [Bacteroidia bacterium]
MKDESTLNELNAISPIDGRYRKQSAVLSSYFSEQALIKYRVRIEIEYFKELVKYKVGPLQKFPANKLSKLDSIWHSFSEPDAKKIKKFEKITNHDVKAVEYFIKEEFEKLGVERYAEFIHFGLTSQDINNTAVPLSYKEFLYNEYIPLLMNLTRALKDHAACWKNISMLAYTHGQPASPTRLGKEMIVFVERIDKQVRQLKQLAPEAKFGGATGNMNAHYVAFPSIKWVVFFNRFIKRLGLNRQQFTTQIEHYDNLAAHFDAIKRINTICLDLSRDIWQYVAMNYFKLKIASNEVGSSAMPHKVNPIDFENAEGNLGISNALLEHLSAKLPVSRLQRDLSDSTVLRNIGVPFAHTFIAFNSLIKGLGKLEVNKEEIYKDLDSNWAVVAEAYQTILRRELFPKPYEKLKELTRTGKPINKQSLHAFVDALDVSDKVKAELKKITPINYTGKY